MSDFIERARTISECLHAYGVHSATLQPELAAPTANAPAIVAAGAGAGAGAETGSGSDTGSNGGSGSSTVGPTTASVRRRRVEAASACQIACSSVLCESLTCCNTGGLRI